MDHVAAIRHAVIVLGRSRRCAARTVKVARRTVDGYVDGAVAPGMRKSCPRPSPKREAARVELTKVVEETKVAKKQQLTAQRAHELLAARGVVVGYTIVKELMAERRRAAAEVFIPLAYKLGDLAEVDFIEVEADIEVGVLGRREIIADVLVKHADILPCARRRHRDVASDWARFHIENDDESF